MKTNWKVISVLAVVLMAAFFAGCDKNDEVKLLLEDEYFSVQDGTLHSGTVPANTSGETVGDITINRNALAGGSSYVSINSEKQISEVYFGVTGVDGYFSVPILATNNSPSLRTAASDAILNTFILLFSQKLNGSFEIQISARLSDGTITAVYKAQINHIEAGTGGLQISLSFNNEKDVDLYVVQPDGRVIYYGDSGENADDSDTGDQIVVWGLDIDSNAECYIDGINNENIFYPRDYIQTGKYEVWVNMYKNCDQSIATNWVITATKEGSLVTPSYGQNPATGVFPVGTPSNGIGSDLNEKAIKVMEFTMQGTASSTATTNSSNSSISELAKIKLKNAGVNF
ncbi:MAG: hypothetical protein LBT04_03125 [Prevotellaceae bacterium]|jgi:hypothetical protein|nr:hypothetical protein [Prevotellaceae bacterium]